MRKRLSMDRWADAGVGTTVLFITLTLTASGAATVVFEQMSDVQSQASTTATEALVDISQGLWVMQILGHASGGAVDRLEVYAKLQPGSPAIAMEEVMLLFFHDDVSMEMQFNATHADSSDYLCTLALAGSVVSADWGGLHVLGPRDIAKITIIDDDGDLDLRSMEHVTITFMPASGLSLEYGFTVPQVLQDGWFTIR